MAGHGQRAIATNDGSPVKEQLNMKRKLLIAAGILGIAALSSSATYAATRELPWTNNIYNVSDPENHTPTVSVFDDGNNKCYVVRSDSLGQSPDSMAISCLKGDGR